MENFGGNIEGGINSEEFKVVDSVETEDTVEYTPLDKKTNLELAALSAKTAKEKGLKLNSLESGVGFAS